MMFMSVLGGGEHRRQLAPLGLQRCTARQPLPLSCQITLSHDFARVRYLDFHLLEVTTCRLAYPTLSPGGLTERGGVDTDCVA